MPGRRRRCRSRLGLGSTFLWAGTALNAAATLWLALWTFARSWHVERRLKAGLEVDEPKLSILANFRGSDRPWLGERRGAER